MLTQPFVPRGWFSIASRDFHLAHRALGIPMGSWVVVKPNGMGLPSIGLSWGLGA